MKRVCLLVITMLLIGCSKDDVGPSGSSEQLKVDVIVLDESNLLSVEQYIYDDRARMTVLNQCDNFHFAKQQSERPQHCMNASFAEKRVVIADVLREMQKEKGSELSKEETQEVVNTIYVP